MKVSYFVIVTNYENNDFIIKDKISGTCGTHGELRNTYKILVGKRERKRPPGRPRRRLEDNIKMNLTEMECEVTYWINTV
jgi:hypothetical protein